MFLEVLEHAFTDSIKILPILFLTYLIMEYLEHKVNIEKECQIRKLKKYGPVLGSVLGILPQCGVSSMASNFYAGRVITLGTLLSVYLATSDEMLPILVSSGAAPGLIIRILALKLLVGMVSGVLVDLIIKKKNTEHHIHELCEQDHCHCDGQKSIWKSALRHTFSIFVFLLLVTIVLTFVIHEFGEEKLAGFIFNRPFIGEALAGLIGLIPNCAASVILTEVYLEGGMSFSALMSGLFVGSGVGLLVLFRENRKHWKENLMIVFLLYVIGVAAGWLLWF